MVVVTEVSLATVFVVVAVAVVVMVVVSRLVHNAPAYAELRNTEPLRR